MALPTFQGADKTNLLPTSGAAPELDTLPLGTDNGDLARADVPLSSAGPSVGWPDSMETDAATALFDLRPDTGSGSTNGALNSCTLSSAGEAAAALASVTPRRSGSAGPGDVPTIAEEMMAWKRTVAASLRAAPGDAMVLSGAPAAAAAGDSAAGNADSSEFEVADARNSAASTPAASPPTPRHRSPRMSAAARTSMRLRRLTMHQSVAVMRPPHRRQPSSGTHQLAAVAAAAAVGAAEQLGGPLSPKAVDVGPPATLSSPAPSDEVREHSDLLTPTSPMPGAVEAGETGGAGTTGTEAAAPAAAEDADGSGGDDVDADDDAMEHAQSFSDEASGNDDDSASRSSADSTDARAETKASQKRPRTNASIPVSTSRDGHAWENATNVAVAGEEDTEERLADVTGPAADEPANKGLRGERRGCSPSPSPPDSTHSPNSPANRAALKASVCKTKLITRPFSGVLAPTSRHVLHVFTSPASPRLPPPTRALCVSGANTALRGSASRSALVPPLALSRAVSRTTMASLLPVLQSPSTPSSEEVCGVVREGSESSASKAESRRGSQCTARNVIEQQQKTSQGRTHSL